MTESNRSTYIIAGAVVFAGLIIAAGVIFGGSGSTNNANTTTDSNTNGSNLLAAAEAAEIDTDEFESCLDSDKFQDKVQKDTTNARNAGGRGTPYNVLVLNDPLSDNTQSQIKNQLNSIKISQDGKRLGLSGAVPYAGMSQIIDMILQDPDSSGEVSSSDDLAVNEITDADHIRGDRDAAVTVVEYSDFGCPFCGRFHSTMKQVMNNYDDNEVAWVYRHFPIPQLHPQAPRIARASECAADIGGEEAFWSFADEVFKG